MLHKLNFISIKMAYHIFKKIYCFFHIGLFIHVGFIINLTISKTKQFKSYIKKNNLNIGYIN